jgi:serine/threonine protein kinase/tetratricopeptide (TPR) repeat protein
MSTPHAGEPKTPAEPDTTTNAAAVGASSSSHVGPYRLLRRVGEGGMGEVWLAEQQRPVRRQVALKVIKAGMDTQEVIARFEAERQALALMNHPNIADVYDAGVTPEGRPYFAMEYVHGIPITEYCDKQRLSIRERLKLFVDVCAGVQHAHQKGIIHRDIKPSNVLVTTQDEKHTPKIIDFGVAKAISQRLTERAVFTELGQIIGTPEYMSPEQAEMTNLDIDTRTDVYSLGVLLYELLAGSRPFDSKELRRAGLAEIQRKLREDEPPRPSSRISSLGADSTVSATNRRVDLRGLERALKGDLDWITMKALEKDRVRRYETAHALALDVERHLNDEPVLAGPPSGLYRVKKLIQRHRGSFLAAGSVVLALVLGVIGTSWALLQAVRAERRAAASAVEARRQTAIAEAVNAFLNQDLLAVARPSAARGQGKDVSMREVLDVAAERIDRASKPGGRFATEPLVEAQIRSTLGDTYLELGEYAAAEPQVKRALEIRRSALGNEHQTTVRTMTMLGLIYWRQSRLDDAAPLFQNAFEISRRVLGQDHTDTLTYEMNLANLHRAKGQYKEAEPLYQYLVETQGRVLGAEHPDTLGTMGNFANFLQETGRYEKAEVLHRQELEIRRRVQGDKAPGTVSTMNNLAGDLDGLGRYEDAVTLMKRALALKIELYGAAHPSTLNSVDGLATFADHMGRDAEAESMNRQALDGRRRALGQSHRLTIDSEWKLANTLSNLGRFAEAERLAATAASQGEESLGERHLTTLSAQDARSKALLGLHRVDEAERILQRVLSTLDNQRKKGEDVGEGDELAARVRVHLAMALAALSRRAETEALLVEAIPRLPPRMADTGRAVRFLVGFYDEWNRTHPDAARAERASEWRRRLGSDTGPAVAR